LRSRSDGIGDVIGGLVIADLIHGMSLRLAIQEDRRRNKLAAVAPIFIVIYNFIIDRVFIQQDCIGMR
jgi:hypothetical protein